MATSMPNDPLVHLVVVFSLILLRGEALRRFRHVARLQRAFGDRELGRKGLALPEDLQPDPSANADRVERALQTLDTTWKVSCSTLNLREIFLSRLFL